MIALLFFLLVAVDFFLLWSSARLACTWLLLATIWAFPVLVFWFIFALALTT